MNMTRRQAALVCGAAFGAWAADSKNANDRVRLLRLPEGGLQPQTAVDERGDLHVVYFAGEPAGGNLFYVRSTGAGIDFSSPLRINTQPGSAIATGTIRGAQLALGRSGRVHVAWNGSSTADPKGPVNPDSGKSGAPMLYSRLNDSGKAFESQRGIMLRSFGLDGGGSIAADQQGNVYVTWHGIAEAEAKGNGEGEARRRVFLSRSENDGKSFSGEQRAWSQATGACGCCGMRTHVDRKGNVWALYRSATQSIHRDIYVLSSKDRGKTFQGSLLHKWDINACPMSSMDIADNGQAVVGAWETGGQVYWTHLDGGSRQPIAPAGEGKGRKHPRIAMNRAGEVLLVWTEGTGWQKGGGLAWQLYDRSGQPVGEQKQMPGIPTWSFAAAIARPDNGFSVLY
jgi:hypothetical protein